LSVGSPIGVRLSWRSLWRLLNKWRDIRDVGVLERQVQFKLALTKNSCTAKWLYRRIICTWNSHVFKMVCVWLVIYFLVAIK
jgi:hypothetical protein